MKPVLVVDSMLYKSLSAAYSNHAELIVLDSLTDKSFVSAHAYQHVDKIILAPDRGSWMNVLIYGSPSPPPIREQMKFPTMLERLRPRVVLQDVGPPMLYTYVQFVEFSSNSKHALTFALPLHPQVKEVLGWLTYFNNKDRA